MCTKGNRINNIGAYFGCGGCDCEWVKNANLNELSTLDEMQKNDFFGLYLNLNGKEQKISDSTAL
jgi:hypothetical protein